MSVRPTRRLTGMCFMVIVSTTVNGATIAQAVSPTSRAPISTISNESPRDSDMDSSNSAPHTAHTQKYALPPPFTAQEFWAKVVHLLGEKKGYVTHEQFEHAFGVKMNNGTTDEYSRAYGVGAGNDWYMKASILETTAQYQSASGPSGLTTN